MKAKNRWLYLSLSFCLVFGVVAYLLVVSPAAVYADDTQPPAEEIGLVTPEASPSPAAQTQEEIELRAALDALEAARHQGPEAVVALLDTLRGRGLDMVMDEILEAQEQLARSAPPLPEGKPVSLAEEEEILQTQLAREAANRAQALAIHTGLDENESQIPATQYPTVPNAPAADLTVGSPPCTYTTIGAAVTAANPGDRLLIGGGVTFNENIIVHKNLTLQGGYDGCGGSTPAQTTINGGGSGTVAVIDASLTVTLTNLILTNGIYSGEGGGIRFAIGSGGGVLTLNQVDIYGNTSFWGGGIWVGPNGQVVGTDVEIYNNTASIYGGGVRLYGSRVTFSDSNIYNNTAPSGAGVYGTLQDGFASQLDLPSYADLYDNTALTGDGFGGGVYMREGTVSLTGCSDLFSNDAFLGGGAYLVTGTLTIAGDCSEIYENTATSYGGGIYAQGSTVNMDQDAALLSNIAGASGGGAYLDNSDLWGDKALIYYNTAENFGGGVYAANDSLLDMDLGGYACTGPRCSRLSYNTATNTYGGGVYATGSSEVDLHQVFIENNSASYGGGIYAYQSPVYLYNTLVARNDATDGTGDGLRLYTGSSLTGENNTLANNDAGGAATGNAIGMTSASMSLSNSIVWGHTTSINLTGQTVACSDIQGGYTGTGNMDIDPLFIDPANINFHLQSTSPVIDRCTSGQSLDFDNESRPITYIRPATPYDMGADEASARVGINGATCAYGRIQDAVDAAASGDTIQAVTDVFYEMVEINGNNLTLAGGYDVDCTTYITGTTTVNGGDAGSVFDIDESVVTLRDLDITGGNSGIGGGVSIPPGNSRVTLDNTDVFSNQSGFGGGVYVDVGNVLTITNDSDIHDNTATTYGGGARVWGKLVGDDWASSISNNTAPDGGGVSVPGGVLEFRGSHVTNNQATAAAGLGGGIHVYAGGVITLTGSSNINLNRAYNGAGIYADSASVHLHAVVHSNVAANNGGGVYMTNGSTLSANNTYIGYPASGWGSNTAINGAGLYVDASTLDFDGYIRNNIASSTGGGVYAITSTLNLVDTQVGGVDANQANQLGVNGHLGAGLYLANGTHAVLDNTVVAGNAFQTAVFTYGGGAYVAGGSVVTLTNSTIEQHQALSADDGRGAGLYIYDSMVTLDHSRVLSNTAGTLGGGLRLYGTSTLNVLNDSELRYNHALNGEGGAVAAAGTPDINISDSMLQDNTAGTHGGAVYLDAGALDFTGWWSVRDNTAGGNGGAVAVVGTGNAGFSTTTAGSSMLYNHASGNGGALYVNNNSALELHATGGYLLSLSGNYASGNGGAAYADNGALFDVYGWVVITANQASGGRGGAFYLSNSSRLWLDDYVNDVPEVRENWAQDGGAIYAQNSPRVECDGAKFGYTPGGNYATSGSGGAIYLDNSIFDADNCVFYNNQATDHGGAIAAYASTLNIHASFPLMSQASERTAGQDPQDPQVLLATSCNPLAGQCSSFYGNVADSDSNTSGYGGAIYTSDSTLNVGYTYLHRNRAARGGAIYQVGAAAVAQVSNTLIYSNTVTTALGAGILTDGSVFTVTHTTIANNVGGAGFSGFASAVYNTIAWGNTDAGFESVPGIASCNIDDGGNAGSTVNPQFSAPGAGENYHLRRTSPAINACGTGLSLDLNNVPRPYESGYDMGAYEYAHDMAFTPDHSSLGSSPGVVVYTHTLTNTGSAADTYILTALSSNGWSVTLDPAAPITLNGEQSIVITVSLNIPTSVPNDILDILVITATSSADPGLTASVTDTTTTYTLYQIYLPLVLRNPSD
jgi:predicted outer membrane repeat protein